jgi:hypothetical protein
MAEGDKREMHHRNWLYEWQSGLAVPALFAALNCHFAGSKDVGWVYTELLPGSQKWKSRFIPSMEVEP